MGELNVLALNSVCYAWWCVQDDTLDETLRMQIFTPYSRFLFQLVSQRVEKEAADHLIAALASTNSYLNLIINF